MSGSVVPERVHRWAGDTGWAGDVHAGAVGQTDSVAGGAGSGFGEVPGSGEGTGGAGADSGSSVSAQRAKRRYCQRIPLGSEACGTESSSLGWRRRRQKRSVARRSTASFGSTGTRPSTSTIIISTLTTTISARCSLRCVATRRGESNCASTAMNGRSANWRRERLATRRWTTVSFPAPSPKSFSRSAIHWDRSKSSGCSGNG